MLSSESQRSQGGARGESRMTSSKRKKPKLRAYNRFWDRVKKRHSNFCWDWLGLKNERGYGRFWMNGKLRKAHVVAYGWLIGRIPEGMELDHLCRNTSCVNPSHLQPVTHAENVRRGASPAAKNQARAKCVNGHPFSGKNLYLYKGIHRHCRTCRATRSNRRWRETKRKKAQF